MSNVKLDVTNTASYMTRKIVKENGGEFIFNEYAVPKEFFSGKECYVLFSLNQHEKYIIPKDEVVITFLD